MYNINPVCAAHPVLILLWGFVWADIIQLRRGKTDIWKYMQGERNKKALSGFAVNISLT